MIDQFPEWIKSYPLMDPLCWIILAEAMAGLIIGLMLIRQPIRCGWNKRKLYQAISVVFFAQAIHALDRFVARHEAIMGNTGQLIPGTRLIFSDTAVLISLLLLLGALGINHFKCVEHNRISNGGE